MLKFAKIITISILLLTVFTSCKEQSATNTEDNGRTLVYASFYPMYDLAQKAVGDLAEVRCLIPDGTEPHDWEPTPKDIATLEKADLFVYSSDKFETWAESVLAGVKNEKLKSVQASVYSGYSGGDPHTWLSPVEAKLQFIAICDALSVADPENSDGYKSNKEQWTEEFNKLDAEYSELREFSRKKILVTHAAFGRLCAEYDLEQIAVVEGSPDSEPDPAKMAEIIATARENGITTILYEELSGARLAKAIAGEIGGKSAPLSALEGLTGDERKNGDDYFSVMRKNLMVLREALV